MINVEQVRSETSACEQVNHLHHCGASLMPDCVANAVKSHIDLECLHGGYEAEALAKADIEQFFVEGARMLNCDAQEIAYMENATAAWNSVFYGFARTLNTGDTIITANAEYASNYIAYLDVQKQTGCRIKVIADDEYGQISVKALADAIDSSTRLISITHVPTSGGLVNPAKEIGEIAKAEGIPFLLDACQSAGQMPLDVEELNVDALSLTGRKFLRGPRGTGLLYVRRESMDRFPPATLDLYGATWVAADRFEYAEGARRYSNWENNVAGLIGLGVALAYANDLGLEQIRSRISMLAERFRQGLISMRGAEVLDQGQVRCGIVSFLMNDLAPEVVQQQLRERGIQIGASARCSTRLDMERRGLTTINRAGIHYVNTEAEIDALLNALSDLRN